MGVCLRCSLLLRPLFPAAARSAARSAEPGEDQTAPTHVLRPTLLASEGSLLCDPPPEEHEAPHETHHAPREPMLGDDAEAGVEDDLAEVVGVAATREPPVVDEAFPELQHKVLLGVRREHEGGPDDTHDGGDEGARGADVDALHDGDVAGAPVEDEHQRVRHAGEDGRLAGPETGGRGRRGGREVCVCVCVCVRVG